MFSPTNGPARETFPARERVDSDLLEQMISAGTIIIDNRRRRPLYFDGRFLARAILRESRTIFFRASRTSDEWRRRRNPRAVGFGRRHRHFNPNRTRPWLNFRRRSSGPGRDNHGGADRHYRNAAPGRGLWHLANSQRAGAQPVRAFHRGVAPG